MIQGSGKARWEQHSSVTGGPQTDFTNMRQCKGEHQALQMCVVVLSFVEQIQAETLIVSRDKNKTENI